MNPKKYYAKQKKLDTQSMTPSMRNTRKQAKLIYSDRILKGGCPGEGRI